MQTAVSHEAVASFPEVLLTTFTVSLQDKYSYKPVLYKPAVLWKEKKSAHDIWRNVVMNVYNLSV